MQSLLKFKAYNLITLLMSLTTALISIFYSFTDVENAKISTKLNIFKQSGFEC